MEIKLLAFGIARDILHQQEMTMDLNGISSVADVKRFLVAKYPDFEKLKSFSLAVNCNYVADDQLVKDGDEIVIIPPVSGG
ncbi:MAG: MoaD/ThiS family protein [Saprospiraceae bacterium]|nr:MoaD/ThiS family protein [Saprospiraceae bacterium]